MIPDLHVQSLCSHSVLDTADMAQNQDNTIFPERYAVGKPAKSDKGTIGVKRISFVNWRAWIYMYHRTQHHTTLAMSESTNISNFQPSDGA